MVHGEKESIVHNARHKVHATLSNYLSLLELSAYVALCQDMASLHTLTGVFFRTCGGPVGLLGLIAELLPTTSKLAAHSTSQNNPFSSLTASQSTSATPKEAN